MLENLLEYVEIKTKVTSVVTFFLTIAVMLFWNLEIKPLPTVIFFLGMLIFDLTTTSINNYIDTKTNGETIGFNRSLALSITIVLLIISISLGIYLVYLTDISILLIGALCFALGVFYTFGPIPISRQPYGEIISGIAYGYFIPFLLMHSNNLDYLISITYQNSVVSVQFYLIDILKFMLVFIPPTLLTSSIMLANNTCDLEADIKENRFTLVYYIGTAKAVKLMYILYITVYLSVIINIFTHSIPVSTFVVFVGCAGVFKNIKLYKNQLVKDISDIYIIKNFVIILISYTVLIFAGVIARYLG